VGEHEADDVLDRVAGQGDDDEPGEGLRYSELIDRRAQGGDEPVRDEGRPGAGEGEQADREGERDPGALAPRRVLRLSEPMIDVWATTTSPSRRAKTTTNSSGRLPSVDCMSPVAAGPKRWPTCSVENETMWARPASATVAIAKASTASQSA
jgi:hypothetical protein